MALPLAARFLTAQAVFAGSTPGLVPTSAGGTTNFLRADGTWAAPAGGGGGSYTFTATDRLYGRVSAGGGAGEEITCTAAARSILDDASVAAINTTLGLGTGSVVTHERMLVTQTNANQIGLAISGYSLTGSSTVGAIDISGTWNTTGHASLIKANIINSASGGSSRFIDLQINGTTQAYIRYNGEIYAQTTVIAGGSTTMIGGSTYGVWTSGRSISINSDFNFERFAANAGGLRNGTNAQRWEVYNTYASTTSYERLSCDWQSTANLARLMTEKGSGGGTARALALGTDGTDRLTIGAAGGVTVDTLTVSGNTTLNQTTYLAGITNGASIRSVAASQMDLYAGNSATVRLEGGYCYVRNGFGIAGGSPGTGSDVTIRRTSAGVMCFQDATTGGIAIEGIKLAADAAAPAANKGVTYYRDNGSGKMQYCVRFPTGAVQIVATEP